MKKLTDYYVLITPNIIDEVIEYFGLLQSKDYLIGKYFLFRYDDKESYYTRPTEPQLRTKLKWSELKRFIENSPTREKYRSVQNSVKGYKTHNSKLSLLCKKQTNQIESVKHILKTKQTKNVSNIADLARSFKHERQKVEVQKSNLIDTVNKRDAEIDELKNHISRYRDSNDRLIQNNGELRAKNQTLHNELLDSEKEIEALIKANYSLAYFEYWCDDLNTELQQKSKQLKRYKLIGLGLFVITLIVTLL